jgi:hypothetical protein
MPPTHAPTPAPDREVASRTPPATITAEPGIASPTSPASRPADAPSFSPRSMAGTKSDFCGMLASGSTWAWSTFPRLYVAKARGR